MIFLSKLQTKICWFLFMCHGGGVAYSSNDIGRINEVTLRRARHTVG